MVEVPNCFEFTQTQISSAEEETDETLDEESSDNEDRPDQEEPNDIPAENFGCAVSFKLYFVLILHLKQ